MERPNFFCGIETLNLLLKQELPDIEPELELSVDLIELPYLFLYTVEADAWNLKVLSRGELYDHKSGSGVEKGQLKVDRASSQGTGTCSDKLLSEHMGAFFQACQQLSRYIQKEGLQPLCEGLDPEEAGVLLEAEGDKIKARVVSGKERPELMCTTLFGGTVMCRPYMEDFMERSAMDLMSLEEKIEKAEGGDKFAMAQLAQAYLNGDDEVEQDPAQAAYWYRKEAELKDPEGAFNLGLLYAKGFGVERDFEQAAAWMEKAVSWGDKDGEAPGNQYRAMAEDLKKAQAGDAAAMAAVAGTFMALGGSLDQAGPGEDYKQSLYWARKAVDAGCAAGFWPLALAYEHGRGVEKDTAKATELFRKGAELGDANCQHSYGCRLMNGEGVPKDAKQAFELFRKSAEQGNGLAMRDLGRCYQFGNGCMGNMKTAVEWYEKALEIIDDPELAQKTALFKQLADSDPGWGEDYPGEEEHPWFIPHKDEDPMPPFDFGLSYTKKGERKARSEKVKVGDAVRFSMSEVDTRIDASTAAGDVGDIAAESWIKRVVEEQIPYHAEVIESVPYSKLENKRKNPVIQVRLQIDMTCGEFKKRLGWAFIPSEIFGDGSPMPAWPGVFAQEEDEPQSPVEVSEPREEQKPEPQPEILPVETVGTAVRYDEHLLLQLPEGYEAERRRDEEGKESFQILYGVTVNDEGEKSAEMKMILGSRPKNKDDTLETEKCKLKGNFPATGTATVKEQQVLFFTLYAVIAVVIVVGEENIYTLAATRVCRQAEESRGELEMMTRHMSAALNAMVIDGKRASFEPLSPELLLEADAGDEATDADPAAGEFPTADPGPGQHTQLDFQQKTKAALGFFGNFSVNQTGTEFCLRSISEGFYLDDEPFAPIEQAAALDRGPFPAGERAAEMAELFRVNYEVFDPQHDREQEILGGMIQRAATYNGLRSFAWTLSAYCRRENTTPDKLSSRKLREMLRFLEMRNWLNYQADEHCPSLCSGNDIHVFYLPDALPEEQRKAILELANKDENGSGGGCTVMSLDGLRRDLSWMQPAMETLYRSLAEDRDRDEALTGNAADMLYAWCAVCCGVRTPAFSEDGPVNNFFAHPEEQSRWEAEWAARREKMDQEAAASWLKTYEKVLSRGERIQIWGKTFVFAGVEGSERGQEILEKLAAMGGIHRTGVSGKTDYLVCDPRRAGDSKVRSAVEQQKKGKNVKIVLAEELIKALGLETKCAPASAAPESAGKSAKTAAASGEQKAAVRELAQTLQAIPQGLANTCSAVLGRMAPEPAQRAPAPSLKAGGVTLRYTQGLKVRGKDYELELPDGFRFRENAENRDFIAWLPGKDDPEAYETAPLAIMAGQDMQEGIGEQFGIPEEFEALAHTSHIQIYDRMSGMFEKQAYLPYLREDLPGGVSVSMDPGVLHANAFLGIGSRLKGFRFQFNELEDEDRKAALDMLPALLDHLHADQPVKLCRELDDPGFSGRPDAGKAKLWKETIDELTRHLAAARMLTQNALVAAFKAKGDTGTKAVEKFKKQLREMLCGVTRAVERRLEKGLKTYQSLQAAWPDEPQLQEMADSLRELAEFTEQSVTLNGADEIKSESQPGKDAVKLLGGKRKASRFLEADRREKEILEEQRKSQEAARKAYDRELAEATERNRELTELYEKSLADWNEEVNQRREANRKAKGLYDQRTDEVMRERERRIETETAQYRNQIQAAISKRLTDAQTAAAYRIQQGNAEIQAARNALAGLGLFKMQEKKAQKERIRLAETAIAEAQIMSAEAQNLAQMEWANLPRLVQGKREALRAQVERELPLPEKPVEQKLRDKPAKPRMCPLPKEPEKPGAVNIKGDFFKGAILCWVTPERRYTGDEIQRGIPLFREADVTPQRITAFLTQLVNESGLVKEVENRRSYYYMTRRKAQGRAMSFWIKKVPDSFKPDLLNWMKPDQVYTAVELQARVPIFQEAGLGLSRVSSMLELFVKDGSLKQTVEEGKNYYSLR